MKIYRTARTDTNHGAIALALRRAGATVLDLHAVGGGCPDLLVGWRGRNLLVEVKTERGELNGVQTAFHLGWAGQAAVARTPAEAVEILLASVREEEKKRTTLS